jgi:hypothetical protein
MGWLSREVGSRARVLGLVVAGACAADEPPPPPRGPVAPPDRRVLRVDLAPAVASSELRWGVERAGALTALVELGLLDLPDVLVEVGGAPAPGFADAVRAGAPVWTARLRVAADASAGPDGLAATLVLCDAAAACTEAVARGPADAMPALAAPLLDAAAAQLGRAPAPDVVAAWSAPLSGDPYAALIAGRAAAVLYGLWPAVEGPGDPRVDPVARAPFLDPSMALAWWVAGRVAAPTDPAAASEAFVRAASLGEIRLGLRAAAAATAPDTADAARGWRAILAFAPRDPRVLVGAARALAADGAVDEAEALLRPLPGDAAGDPAVAAVRVVLADARGAVDDAVLAAWMDAAAGDPRPVRRRVERFVAAGDWAAALALLPELAARGDGAAAQAWEAPLRLAAGDRAGAAASARAAGDATTAARIEARAALEADPAARVPALDAAEDPPARAARAARAAAAGEWDAAEAEAAVALALDPWDPGALRRAAEAAEARGRAAEAAVLRERAAFADPGPPAG